MWIFSDMMHSDYIIVFVGLVKFGLVWLDECKQEYMIFLKLLSEYG